MRFLAEHREIHGRIAPVVVDTTDGRVVAEAETLSDAEEVAAIFERGAA